MSTRSQWWNLGVVVSVLAFFPALLWAADHEKVTCEATSVATVHKGGLYFMTAIAVAVPAALSGFFGSPPARILAWFVVVGLAGLGWVGHSVQKWCFTI